MFKRALRPAHILVFIAIAVMASKRDLPLERQYWLNLEPELWRRFRWQQQCPRID